MQFCSYILRHEAVLKIYCNIYNMLLMEKIFLKQNKDSCAGKEVERGKEQMICMQRKQSEEKVNEHNSWRILLDSLWKYIIAHL